ncbi:MAG: hypothetical protein AAGA61_09540, partial [Pseudomonadota bacterium]
MSLMNLLRAAAATGCVALLGACSSIGDERAGPELAVRDVSLVQNPNPAVPMAAILSATSNVP